ncbi:MAG: septal ring lytic transglycosylase RlpA family protein [Bacteroidota bacterium]
MMNLTPTFHRPRRRRLRATVRRARRKAAVVTGAGLLAAGTGITVAPALVGPSDAPNVEARVEVERPRAVVPPPTSSVSLAEDTEVQLAPAVEPVPVADPAPAEGESVPGGLASYYGAELAGNPTASGERFDPSALTAAHRTLPFGTRLRVTHARTGESVVVRINDRGPFHGDRVIDLSKAAADAIGLTRSGTAQVEIERLPAGARG